MLQTLFIYIWAPLIPMGLFLLVLRPVLLAVRKKNPMGPRAKSVLWFLQAVGFWSFLTGSWMLAQSALPALLDDEDDVPAAAADDDSTSSAKKKKKNSSD